MVKHIPHTNPRFKLYVDLFSFHFFSLSWSFYKFTKVEVDLKKISYFYIFEFTVSFIMCVFISYVTDSLLQWQCTYSLMFFITGTMGHKPKQIHIPMYPNQVCSWQVYVVVVWPQQQIWPKWTLQSMWIRVKVPYVYCVCWFWTINSLSLNIDWAEKFQ